MIDAKVVASFQLHTKFHIYIYVVHSISIQIFFIQAFKIVVDS